MAYASKDNPYITFDTVMQGDAATDLVRNSAVIDTPTPEITKENNGDDYELRRPLADLSLEKTVDRTAVSKDEVDGATQTLTYTLKVTNDGPSDATRPVVTDTLPAGLTYVAASGTGYACTEAAGVVTCTGPTLAVGESVELVVTATIDGSVAPDARLRNNACVESPVADISRDDNCDDVYTTITAAPNVYATKTGPQTAKIATEFVYTIEFGNNGNAAAAGWSLVDTLDAALRLSGTNQIEIVASGATVTCDVGLVTGGDGVERQTIICSTADKVLPAGAKGTIKLTVKVADDQSLVDKETVIKNRVCAATADAQTDVSDDCYDHDTKVVQGEPGTITGRVFADLDTNAHYDEGSDLPLEGVPILLTGTDSRGNQVRETTTTDANGDYFFPNLYPGTYFLLETQPINHASTGSTGGYSEVDADGRPLTNSKNGFGSVQLGNLGDKNQIVNIKIDEGDYNQGNDFGELCGTLGNFVWRDLDRDGFADIGEPGIAGVEMSLYLDANGDDIADENELLATTETDAAGNYYFETLDLDDGTNYLIRVTDGGGVLAGAELLPTYADAANYTDDGYSANAEDDAAYGGTLLELVMSDIVGWFDWMDELVNGAEVRRMSLNVRPAVLAAWTPEPSPSVNLTADFGFMTKDTGGGGYPPPTPMCEIAGKESLVASDPNCRDDGTEPGPGDGEPGPGPDVPGTGLGQLLQTVAVPAGMTGIVALLSVGVYAWRRARKARR